MTNLPVCKAPVGQLPALIGQVHADLKSTADGVAHEKPQALEPAVPIKKSVRPDYTVCLDGVCRRTIGW
ncbi:MucR family transcriptional regulator [Mesorhizobium argentiipisi]|uniref:MucR family transcriptional regulator n=1 Tax=Mesorhizobium argentiipisi TaxID=3015175 RepID=UPI0039F63666